MKTTKNSNPANEAAEVKAPIFTDDAAGKLKFFGQRNEWDGLSHLARVRVLIGGVDRDAAKLIEAIAQKPVDTAQDSVADAKAQAEAAKRELTIMAAKIQEALREAEQASWALTQADVINRALQNK